MGYKRQEDYIKERPLIYIVDDCGMQKLLLSKTLSETGFKVRSFTNGFKLMEALDKECPDLIISDIDMPRIDGLKLLKEVKERQQCNHIPFWFLSSFDLADIKNKAASLGGEKFINKPFNRKELIRDVRNRLQPVEKVADHVA